MKPSPAPSVALSTADRTLLASFDPSLFATGDAVGDAYACDWSGDRPLRPPVVFKPRDTDDVARILRRCQRAGQRLVTQGGRTGLSGGATPQSGEWGLSTERMNGIVELDVDSKTITVGAGTPLQRIQDAADAADLVLPLDLGARGSCVAGGLVATNAGGNQVIQHGMARALVLGLEAVLANGEVIASHNKLLKNNAGFDVKQLFIGSEGTLGVITQVTFRLFSKKRSRPTALCALETFDDVIAFLHAMQRSLSVVCAFEVMWADYYQAALRAVGGADPLAGEHAYYVLVETEGDNHETTQAALETALGFAMDNGGVTDAALAQSAAQAGAFWRIRDAVAELIPAMEPVATFDIGVPIPNMERFVASTRQTLAQTFAGCTALVFGHIGDGNLHLLVSTGREQDKPAIFDAVYGQVRDCAGTITAEHGIGSNKRDWLALSRTPAEIELMRTLKTALDPAAILNRGRVIPPTV